MKINFYTNNSEFNNAINEYKSIWNEEGESIVKSIEEISKLKFKNEDIEAEIFEGISISHPLRLRASYSGDVKKATLIHELLHILFVDNDIKIEGGSLEIHKELFLILYDVWAKLYGDDFMKRMIEEESKRTLMYQEAWNWVLSKK